MAKESARIYSGREAGTHSHGRARVALPYLFCGFIFLTVLSSCDRPGVPRRQHDRRGTEAMLPALDLLGEDVRPTTTVEDDALSDVQESTPTLDALLDLLKRGVDHPLAPRKWRVVGLAPYASLQQAVAAGDLYAVADRLRGGADIEARDASGKTPLLVAAEANQPYIADFLLEHGARLDDQDTMGNAVMHLAAQASHLYTLENFFHHGANIEARNARNYTPLHLAAESGDTQVVHHLITLGADMFAMQDPAVLSIPSVLAARQRHWDVTRYFRSRSQFFPLHLMAAQGDEAGVREALDDMPPAVNLLDALQNTPLISAVRTGEAAVVRLLLSRGADVASRNMEGDSALAIALRLEKLECAEILLGSGADINTPLESGFERTLLGEAVRGGSLDRVRFILDHGGNPRAEWEGGRTALHVAAAVKDADKTRLLIERGASPEALDAEGWSPLLLAARNGSTACIEAMAPSGSMVDAPSPGGRIPLHEAAATGQAGTVAWLLDHGASPDSRDGMAQTALHRSAEGDELEVATLLLDRGAMSDLADQNGETPLLVAVAKGADDMVHLMLDRGVNPGQVDAQERNAVYIALEHGHEALARRLVERGVSATRKDHFRHTTLFPAARTGNEKTLAWLTGLGVSITDRDYQGRTAIHAAAQSGALESLQYLLQHGGVADAPDEAGTRPLHLAAERGNRQVLQQLLWAGVDVSAKNAIGDAPIHLAARKGRVASIELLAAMGADVNDRDGKNMTPLYGAVARGHYDAVSTLLHNGASLVATPENSPTLLQLVENSLQKVELSNRDYARPARLRLRALLDAAILEAFRRAASWGDESAMEALLDTYPEYMDESSFGLTPAHWAACNGKTGVLRILQRHGADLTRRARTADGFTAIHFAARQAFPETVTWLLDSGIPRDLKSLSGQTVEDLAPGITHTGAVATDSSAGPGR